jgi:excisionase family DNA binding protein
MREVKEGRKYLTTTRAARLAHVSPSTLLRAIQNKKLKAFSTPGGHFRIDTDSLQLFLAASGLSEGSEKRQVILLPLSSRDQETLLKEIRGDKAFSVVDAKRAPKSSDKGSPAIILLPTAKGSPSGDSPLNLLKRLCGLS